MDLVVFHTLDGRGQDCQRWEAHHAGATQAAGLVLPDLQRVARENSNVTLYRRIAALIVLFVVAAVLALWHHERKAAGSNRHSDNVSTIRRRAERGNSKAQFDLGSAYYYGKGVHQSYAEALRWYKMAADQGELRAEDALGYMYFSGYGVPQDYNQALQWYKRAAEQGDAKSQFDFASMYYYGIGVPQDYAEALRWCHKAADQNYAEAQDAVGSLYYSGLGVPRDQTEAFLWYQKAAEQGYAKAEFDLASMYYSGNGTSQNYAEARRWYLKAAKQGNADARQALGLFGESATVRKLEYVELVAGLPLGLWLLAAFFVHRGDLLDWRQAALLLLGLIFLANCGMSLYVIVHGGLLYCSYPAAFHIARRVLLGTVILIIFTVVLPAKRNQSLPRTT